MIIGPSHGYYCVIHQIPRVITPLCIAYSFYLTSQLVVSSSNKTDPSMRWNKWLISITICCLFNSFSFSKSQI